MKIRDADFDDAVRLAQLLGELGYPATPSDVGERLIYLSDCAMSRVVVCEDGDRVVGCICLHITPLFHLSGSMGRITALVVDAQHRNRGIGKTLLDAAHEWFDKGGCAYYEVTSGDQRVRAHTFYETNGYVRKSMRFLLNSKRFQQA